MHLKKKKNLNKVYKFSKILLLIITLSMIFIKCLKLIEKNVIPAIMNYAEKQIQELSSVIVSKCINEEILNNIDLDNLYIFTYEDKKIKTIDYNPIILNKILIDSLTITRKALKDSPSLKKYKVPIGIVFNIPFFNDSGPKITATFDTIGDISTNLNNKITSYGINNAIIETSIVISVSYDITIPMSTKKINSTFSIPISIKIIEGDIPNYYLSGYNQNSSILSLPID